MFTNCGRTYVHSEHTDGDTYCDGVLWQAVQVTAWPCCGVSTLDNCQC